MWFARGVAGLAPLLVLMAGCQQPASQNPIDKQTISARMASTQSPVERGKYLVTVGGCNDCHTPKMMTPNGPEPDMSRTLSGQPATEKLAPVPAGLITPEKYGAVTNNHLTAWVGAWGVSYAMNLTPDKATGLGSWTQEMFVNALRSGKHQGTGRPILPPMPWYWYRNMTDDDLKAMFVYLQSLPPINNPVPDPLPPDKIPR
jgi:hypothetical protein